MKTIHKILLITLILFFGACEKQLYKDPLVLLSPDQLDTEPTLTGIESSVKSSYQMLSSTLNIIGTWQWSMGTVMRNDFILQDIASDDMQKKWNPDGDQAWMDELDNFSFVASNQAFNGQWTYDYEGINRANYAIHYLTDNNVVAEVGLSQALRDRLLGEVYFLRAFYYFDLVTNFGAVPLLIKKIETFDEVYDLAVRKSAAEIWTQIKTDLENAEDLLPAGKFSSTQEPWRVSKGAAMAMLAKVALYNEEWQQVIDKAGELKTLAYYDLNDHYFDSFDTDKEFTDDEVIFAYDHTKQSTPSNGNGLCALLNWGFIAPTEDFVDEFEANDPRLLYTVDVPNKAVHKILGETNSSNKGNDDHTSNKIYIRWADVLLWEAEAQNELANYTAAIGIINAIRARARNTPDINGDPLPAGTLPDRPASTDKAQIKEWLIHERRVELGFENHRFNDLKRWGLAESVLAAHGKSFKTHHALYPIPQGEIDKSGGTITQNSGY